QAQREELNGDPQVYTNPITEPQSGLKANFDQDAPHTKELAQGLEALASQPESVKTPDLAQRLSSVQAYLERRHAAGEPAEARRA
ncbi:uroporphyrinogen-III C-methyltransferase, partial [Pseudomonas syringae pv. tagetis]|uniref:uroporphyrinogen-III C-methyltransferase n=1 Tax=Pseudomonas syringae group genomosp. 7 TaxID=251699 RepID=UPI00377047AD